MNFEEEIEALRGHIDDLKTFQYQEYPAALRAIMDRLDALETATSVGKKNAKPPNEIMAIVMEKRPTWLGKKTSTELAESCGIEPTHSNLIALGRCLVKVGAKRGSDGKTRYYWFGRVN